MSAKPIGTGIAGLGRSGWDIHAKTISKLPDSYKLVAVFDQEPDRLNEAQKEFGCRTYAKYEKFLSDPEVELVIVATPSYLHSRHAISALEAGRHVLCEKPMAVSVKEADRMIEAARASRRIFSVFQNRRCDSDFQKIKEVIESGRIGKVRVIRMAQQSFQRRSDWQTLKECGGGILNNWGAHLLDQAMVLIGDEEPEILCHLAHTVSAGDAEDHARITLKVPGGMVVDVELSSCAAFSQDNWFVIGTWGGIKGTNQELSIRWFDPNLLPAVQADRRPPKNRNYGTYEEIPWQTEVWRASESHYPGWEKIHTDLYQTIREDAPLVVTPESARRYIALIAHCKEVSPV